MTQVLAFLALGTVAGSAFLALVCCMASGRLREAHQDDEQCAALAEWNSKHRKHSNTAVSASH